MRVMLVPNDLYEDSVEDARRIEAWLDDRGVDVVRAPTYGFDGGADLDGVGLVVSLGETAPSCARRGSSATARRRSSACPTAIWAF